MIVLQTNVPEYPVKRGKVRDVYDIGNDKLVIVSTDRISAFDFVLPNGIPEKGKVLTGVTKFWFDIIAKEMPTHFLTDQIGEMPKPFANDPATFAGRTMMVEKCRVFPVECIVRGYISGSGWAEYKDKGTVGGHPMPKHLQESQHLYGGLFTPTTKAETGHDESINFDQFTELVGGRKIAHDLRERSLAIYDRGAYEAWKKGIIIADTKFEFGISDDPLVHPGERHDLESEEGKIRSIVVVDEVMTPDSSRYWPMESYCLGKSPPSLDKQYVRNYLLGCGWDRKSSPPVLPDDVVQKTGELYKELYRRLVG